MYKDWGKQNSNRGCSRHLRSAYLSHSYLLEGSAESVPESRSAANLRPT